MAEVSLTVAELASGTHQSAIASVALTVGEAISVSTTSGVTNATKADNSDGLADGICLSAAGIGNTVIYAPTNTTITTSGLTQGEVYVLSSTAGDLELVTDLATNDYVTIIGVASSATELQISIFESGVQHP